MLRSSPTRWGRRPDAGTEVVLRFVLLLFAALLAGPVAAADLRLLTVPAYRFVAQDVAAMYQRDTGHKVTIAVDSANRLVHRIDKAGEAFDVVVLPQRAIERLIGTRKIYDDSLTDLAQSGFGVAVGLSAPRPDVSNPENLRRVLLAARAVSYVDPYAGGAADLYLEQLFQNMGILFEMRAKTVPAIGGYAAQVVASGQADIAIQQASELMVVPGVQFVGLLPASIQRYTVYTGAVSLGTRDVDAAALLLEALARADEAGVLRRRGMEPISF